MDKAVEKEKSSRKSRDERERNRDKDRDYSKDHHRESDRHRDHDRDGSHKHNSDRYKDDNSYKDKNSGSRRSKEDKHRDGVRHRSRDYEEDKVKERREKRRFGDKVFDDYKDLNERKRSVDGETRDVAESDREERRVRRKFEDRPKEDGMAVVEEETEPVLGVNSVNKEPVDERVDNAQSTVSTNGSGSIANGAALESLNVASKVVPETSAPSQPSPIKVSSISTTNENKGVSVTRSHEVPGKSSTDGTTSAAGRNGSLSLDALAKAKKALQMQKELSEKLKKIPLLNKGAGSDGTSIQLGSTDKEGAKYQLASAARQQGAVPPSTATILQAKSSITNVPTAATASVKPSTSGMTALPGLTTQANLDAVKRAQELAAKMGFHQDPEFAPLINMFPGSTATEVAVQQKPSKAPVLRLDALGREIDEHGNVINMSKPTNLSTLKVNINKQKKEAFQILKPELDVDPDLNPHFDPGMGINKTKLLRPKRMNFQFVEEGKWAKQAEIIRFKSQFGEAQAKELKTKQAQLAKAKAEPDINPNLIELSERVVKKEKPKDPIPETEWWDVPILVSGTYGNLNEGNITGGELKMDKFTIYVEHPLPIEPPAEPAPPPPQPLKLTKKEQKKLRTQRRLAKEKDRQEMIRQGLLEPPKPKVKMSNLMKVLGSEATQDPTKLEMEIRSAAAEREQAHVDRNIARKLTPAERREKKERKLFEDANTVETLVSVYRINDLSHPQTRFKVDVNAQENRLTGCAVISDGISVVVVEGGSKPIKRYGKLMLRRINWAASVGNEEDEEDEDEDKPVNKCDLVWQGSVAKPGFNKFLVHQCRTEAAARKVFSDAGVGHYWDLALNYTGD